jgi:hypothetical protein
MVERWRIGLTPVWKDVVGSSAHSSRLYLEVGFGAASPPSTDDFALIDKTDRRTGSTILRSAVP